MIELHTPAHEHTITADHYEFSFGRHAGNDDTITHLALHMIEGDQRYTLAMTLADAEQVGKLLVSHTDYVAGRPPRDW
jgi:hypothetical protein